MELFGATVGAVGAVVGLAVGDKPVAAAAGAVVVTKWLWQQAAWLAAKRSPPQTPRLRLESTYANQSAKHEFSSLDLTCHGFV